MAEAFDVATPSGSLSYHRIGRHGPVMFGPPGAFYPVAAILGNPVTSGYVRSLAAFASGILMDRRGLGWSDPLPLDRAPTLTHQVEDLLCVLDHAQVDQAYLLAQGFDAQPVLAFAALFPERTAGVIAIGTTAKLTRSHDHPTGLDESTIDAWLATIDPSHRKSSTASLDLKGLVMGTEADQQFREWFDRSGRDGASPATARRYLEAAVGFDVRDEVTRIQAPVLVLHNRGDRLINIAEARELADLAPNARLVERDRSDHTIFVGDYSDVVAHIERFVTGSTGRRRRTRARAGWDALTPAELRVVTLVTEGKSNAEIAKQLVVSAETVKSHLKAAFLKTGAKSRTDLTRQYLSSRDRTT